MVEEKEQEDSGRNTRKSEKVRSHTQQQIKIKAAPNSLVTLSAVDNGVLQVSDFQTPDPYGYFYARRALGVNDFDVYPLLLPELRARLSSTGGDSETDMTKRTNPMPAKRIKILSYWSGIKKTDGNGEAIFQVDIPQFSGEVRLMAVSYRMNSFGSAESKMTVADPLVLSTALPRFLSPSDSIRVPVTLTNHGLLPQRADQQHSTSGRYTGFRNKEQSFTIAPNSEKRLYFTVSAAPVIGTGKISLTVNGYSEEDSLTRQRSVFVPHRSLQKHTGSGSIAGGSAQTFSFDNADFLPVQYQQTVIPYPFPRRRTE